MKKDVKRRLRQLFFDEQKGLCGICGREMSGPFSELLNFDHIIPVCDGGKSVPGNLRLAHLSCNVKRGLLAEAAAARRRRRHKAQRAARAARTSSA